MDADSPAPETAEEEAVPPKKSMFSRVKSFFGRKPKHEKKAKSPSKRGSRQRATVHETTPTRVLEQSGRPVSGSPASRSAEAPEDLRASAARDRGGSSVRPAGGQGGDGSYSASPSLDILISTDKKAIKEELAKKLNRRSFDEGLPKSPVGTPTAVEDEDSCGKNMFAGQGGSAGRPGKPDIGGSDTSLMSMGSSENEDDFFKSPWKSAETSTIRPLSSSDGDLADLSDLDAVATQTEMLDHSAAKAKRGVRQRGRRPPTMMPKVEEKNVLELASTFLPTDGSSSPALIPDKKLVHTRKTPAECSKLAGKSDAVVSPTDTIKPGAAPPIAEESAEKPSAKVAPPVMRHKDAPPKPAPRPTSPVGSERASDKSSPSHNLSASMDEGSLTVASLQSTPIHMRKERPISSPGYAGTPSRPKGAGLMPTSDVESALANIMKERFKKAGSAADVSADSTEVDTEVTSTETKNEEPSVPALPQVVLDPAEDVATDTSAAMDSPERSNADSVSPRTKRSKLVATGLVGRSKTTEVDVNEVEAAARAISLSRSFHGEGKKGSPRRFTGPKASESAEETSEMKEEANLPEWARLARKKKQDKESSEQKVTSPVEEPAHEANESPPSKASAPVFPKPKPKVAMPTKLPSPKQERKSVLATPNRLSAVEPEINKTKSVGLNRPPSPTKEDKFPAGTSSVPVSTETETKKGPRPLSKPTLDRPAVSLKPTVNKPATSDKPSVSGKPTLIPRGTATEKPAPPALVIKKDDQSDMSNVRPSALLRGSVYNKQSTAGNETAATQGDKDTLSVSPPWKGALRDRSVSFKTGKGPGAGAEGSQVKPRTYSLKQGKDLVIIDKKSSPPTAESKDVSRADSEGSAAAQRSSSGGEGEDGSEQSKSVRDMLRKFQK